VSRRRTRARQDQRAARPEQPRASAPERQRPAPERQRPAPERPASSHAMRLGLLGQVGVLVVIFAVTVLIAELAGAANLGVAFGVGQVAFALGVVYFLLRG
jgi:hypothetical protein